MMVRLHPCATDPTNPNRYTDSSDIRAQAEFIGGRPRPSGLLRRVWRPRLTA
jgi:hypothetical protein